MSWASSERLMYVQFISCVYGVMSKFLRKSNLEHKLRILEIVILSTKWKKLQITQKLVYQRFYVHEIAPSIYAKITSWKMKRKHVNQTNVI